MRILLAEDNRDIAKALVTLLGKNGYTVDAVYDGGNALEYALSGNYDGILLDVMMPVYDGMEVLARLRRAKVSTPVLMLTAKAEIEDRVAGLDAGADDYLPKPFAISELLARIRAMLRRRSNFQPDILEVHGVKLNKGTMELSYHGESVHLALREFQVAQMLMENSGNILSTDTLMEHIWGWDSDVEMNTVWVTVSNIRKKLQSIHAPLSVRAVRGVGYTLEASV